MAVVGATWCSRPARPVPAPAGHHHQRYLGQRHLRHDLRDQRLQHQCTPGLRRPLDLRHERDARQHRRGHGQGPGRSARRLCRAARRGSQDRAHFARSPSSISARSSRASDATGEQVLSNTLAVMSRDGTLARYGRSNRPETSRPRRNPLGGLFVCAASCPPEVAAFVATADERLGHAAFSQGASYGEGKVAPKRFAWPALVGHGLFRRIPATLRLPPSRGNRSRLRSYDPWSVRG